MTTKLITQMATTSPTPPSSSHRFDVRSIPCRTKHGMIFDRWHELAIGDGFILVNDHDPVPLYYQFSAMFGGAFSWEYEERGPNQFEVRITRLAPDPAQPAVPPPGTATASSSAARCPSVSSS